MALTIDIHGLSLLYLQEHIFRLQDYFFDKFLWALTQADPYLIYRPETELAQDIETYDLMQPPVNMEMKITLLDTNAVLVDNPESEKAINISIKRIEMGADASKSQSEPRFVNYPEKNALTNEIRIKIEQIMMKERQSGHVVSPAFDMNVTMRNLVMTERIRMVSCNEMDKSNHMQVVIPGDLLLDMPLELYTYFLLCSDLNLTYQDTLQQRCFDSFRLLPDYLNLSEPLHLPKSTIDVSLLGALTVRLHSRDLGHVELTLRGSEIKVVMYLDQQMTVNLEARQAGWQQEVREGEWLQMFGGQGRRQSELRDVSPELKVQVDMYEAKKTIKVDLKDVILKAQYYQLMSLKHFLLEGMPKHRQQNRHKPFGFKEDDQDCPMMVTTLTLTNGLLCLPQREAVRSEDFPHGCLVLQTDLTFNFEQLNIKEVKDGVILKKASKERSSYLTMKADIKSLTGFLCSLQDLERLSFDQVPKRKIISSLPILYQDVSFLEFDGKLLHGRRTLIHLKEPLVASIAVSDYPLLSSVGEKLQNDMKAFGEFDNEYEVSQIAERVRVEGQVDLASIDVTMFEVQRQSMYCSIMSESQGNLNPLVAVGIKRFSFKSTELLRNSELKLKLKGASTSYFDPIHQLWEPFLDPCNLRYSASSSGNSTLDLPTPLNLNLTPESLSVLLPALSHTKIQSKEPLPYRHLTALAFTVDNLSSHDISLCDDTLEVLSGESAQVPWAVEQEAKKYIEWKSGKREFCVYFNNSCKASYQKVPIYSINFGGTQGSIMLTSKATKAVQVDGHDIWFCFKKHDFLKKLVIREKYVIRNRTSDVILALRSENQMRTQSIVIQPQKVAWFSNFDIHEFEVEVLTAEGQRTEVQIPRILEDSEFRIKIDLNVAEKGIMHFALVYEVGQNLVDITLQPYMAIVNMLPFTLSFTTYQDRPLTSEQIPPNTIQQITSATSLQGLNLHCSEESTFTTQLDQEIFSEDNLLPREHTITLTDTRGNIQVVYLKVDSHSSAAQRLLVYSKRIIQSPGDINIYLPDRQRPQSSLKTLMVSQDTVSFALMEDATDKDEVRFEIIGEAATYKVKTDDKVAEYTVKVVERKYDGIGEMDGKIRCTIAMVNPSYVIRNRSKVQVQYQTSGFQDYQRIEPQSTQNLLLSNSIEANHTITLMLPYTNSSKAFPLSIATSTLLTFEKESMIGSQQTLKVIIQQDEGTGTTFITLRDPKEPSLTIDNQTAMLIALSQVGDDDRVFRVARNRIITLSFGQILRDGTSQIELHIENQKVIINTEDVGNQAQIYIDQWKTAYVYTELAAELGMTIRITERVRADSSLDLKVKAFSLSMISRFNILGKPLLLEEPLASQTRREIAVFSFKELRLNQFQSLKTTVIDLRLGSFQIDYNANEPAHSLTILSPRHSSFMNAANLASIDSQCFLFVRFSKIQGRRALESAIPTISIALEPFFLYLNDTFIIEMKDFQNLVDAITFHLHIIQALEKQHVFEDDVPLTSTAKIEEVQVSKIKMRFSFQSGTNIQEVLESAGIKNLLMNHIAQIFARVATNVHRCPINLDAISLKEPNDGDYMEGLISHYTTGFQWNIGNLVGHNEFFGKPLDSLGQIVKGTEDFFSHTYQGFLQPSTLPRHLHEGTRSLVTKAFTGIFRPIGSISQSFSHVGIIFTQDRGYEQRRDRDLQEETKNLVEGVGQGFQQVMKGVAEGLVGVVVEPYQGAKQSGFRGFLNGTWSSAKGLVLKPFCGTLDLVSKSSKGLVKSVNTIMGEDGGEEVAEKLRKGNRPMYGREGWIEKWDQGAAKVVQELEFIDGQKYKDCHLLDSYFLGTQHTIVFTLQHLLIVNQLTLDVDASCNPKELYLPSTRPQPLALKEQIFRLQLHSESGPVFWEKVLSRHDARILTAKFTQYLQYIHAE